MSVRKMARSLRAALVAASAIVTLAVLLPTPAGAAEGVKAARLVERLSQSIDPAGAFVALSLSDQEAVRHFLTLYSVTDVSSLLIESTGDGRPTTDSITCWTWTWRRDGKNAFGSTLWSYFQRIDWCGNGSTITSTPHGVQRTRWGEVYYPFWQWRHIGSSTWGGVGYQSYRAWTQAEFKLCLIPDVGCVQYSYPWLDMTAWADGRGTGSAGG